jgi:heat-inducible transcriptional repressor
METDMLSARQATILKSIAEQYIMKAKPVPSQTLLTVCELGVSSATIRNDMAQLEEEGYITRPHTSAGSIPTDKGYRHYVESIGEVELPPDEKRMVSHLFHQVETDLEQWLNLAATLIARMAHNAAVVTVPKPGACQFKHLELVSLQDRLALLVVVISGARIRQQLITFDYAISQSELTAIANKISTAYSGLTSRQITAKGVALSPFEKQLSVYLVKIMEVEDSREYAEPYVEGLHYTLSQPEFAHNRRLVLTLTDLIEERRLVRSIIPPELSRDRIRVIIGRENRAAEVQNYSVVISRYGLPGQAAGTISVIGPTRMPYARTIATVNYLSSVLNHLVARLYGQETSVRPQDNIN